MVSATQLFILFLRDEQIPVEVPVGLVAAGVAGLGLLMVSAIPYRSFKEIDLRHSYRAIVVMVLVLALIVQEPQTSIFVIGLLYVLSGPVEWVWRVISGHPLEKLPPPLPTEAPQETLS